MEIVSEGSLESISRPASTSKRSCSRSSMTSVSSSVQHSLDILPPEEPSLGWSTRFEVEEDVVITDVTEDVSSDKEDVLTDQVCLHALAEHVDSDVSNISSFFDEASYANGATTFPVNTEQSSGILVVNNEEPCSLSDLSIQDENPDQGEGECSSTTGSCESDAHDPKIRKGMERIKKLDNILSEKVKREKEVKQQRLEQERLWREELDLLEKNRDAGLGKPVDLGPAHVLALGAPNETEGKEDCVSEDSPPVTPLFATQPLVDEKEVLRRQKHQEESCFDTRGEIKGDDNGISTRGNKNRASGSKHKTVHSETTEEEMKKNSKKNKKERKVKKKDFIKRNILLAADASNVVAMTEEEKKRLEEILSDLGDLMEEPVDKDSLVLYGNGFVPSQDEVKQLADIDLRLQSLMPYDEYAALCEQTEHDQQSFQSETPRSVNSSFVSEEETPTFGELVLQEKKDVREMKRRLMAIEEQLQHFQSEDHDEGILSEFLLRQLLNDSSRTTSQATTILDSVTSSSLNCDTASSFDKSSVISSVSSTPTAEQ